jgi:uncharacterized membrane protein
MNKRSNTYWISCGIVAVILVILTFTPLVIPYGVHTPALWGLPYSLWTAILISIAWVILTLIATRVHPGRESEGKK